MTTHLSNTTSKRQSGQRLGLALIILGAFVPATAWCQATGKQGMSPLQPTPGNTDERKLKELMQTGVSEYRKNRFEAARVAFQTAWEIKQHAVVAASLADVEMKLGRYRDAAEHWRFYIKSAPSDRSYAEGQLAECRKHRGNIQVTVDVSGASVFVDGVSVGVAPLSDTVDVDPGSHTLDAALDDRRSPGKQVTLAEGETANVELSVGTDEVRAVPVLPATETASHEAPPTKTRAEGERRTSRTAVVVSGTVLTLAAVGIGIGYAVKANGLRNDADRLRTEIARTADQRLVAQHAICTPVPTPPACDALRISADRSHSATNTSVIAFVAGGVFGVATVATYFLWPKESSSAAAKTGGSVAITPSQVGGATGVQLVGTF